MKLEFLSSVRHTARLLSASATASSTRGDSTQFERQMQASSAQPADIKANSGEYGTQTGTGLGDIMARFNPESLSQKIPDVSMPEVVSKPIETVKSPTTGVKSPALLDARKVNPYKDLSYSERADAVRDLVSKYGGESGVDPLLAMAVAGAESSFNPVAVSADGFNSKGLFQLLDSTGKELHQQSGEEGAYDPFSPHQNTKLGVRYLRKLHDLFSRGGDLSDGLSAIKAANSTSLEKLAVAAFNAGEGRVASAQSRAKAAGMDPANYDQISSYLPKTTQEYVTRVMKFRNEFEGIAFGGSEKDLEGKSELAKRLQEVGKGSTRG